MFADLEKRKPTEYALTLEAKIPSKPSAKDDSEERAFRPVGKGGAPQPEAPKGMEPGGMPPPMLPMLPEAGVPMTGDPEAVLGAPMPMTEETPKTNPKGVSKTPKGGFGGKQ